MLKKFLDDDSDMQALSLTARALREEEERREEQRALQQVGARGGGGVRTHTHACM